MSESEKDESERDPKIIVDTDWKEQVAKEKAAAAEQDSESESEPHVTAEDTPPEDPTPTAADETAPEDTAPSETGADSEMPPPPPASFEMLVSMLFTQAMAALGQIPDPATGKATVNKPYAKHYIDTMEMLGEKTKGNLGETESKMLSEALHALRMTYVNARQS